MWSAVELSDVHYIVLVLQNGGFVVVDIEVIGGGKDGHNTWETCRSSLAVHSISGILSFMGSDDGEEIVLL